MSRLAPALSERNETELERCDRHLSELMQEVRVAQTGVQVLFGFLLTVPFTVRFDSLSGGERPLYFATLGLTGGAAMLLIAPSAHHRVLFRCGDKHHLVRVANRYALAGLACVACAMVGALIFVADVVFGSVFAGLLGAGAAVACGWCWYGQPLRRRKTLYAHSSTKQTSAGRDRLRSVPASSAASATETDA
jgi:hypothetical protein